MLHNVTEAEKVFTVEEVRARAKALLVKFGVLDQEERNLYFGLNDQQYLTPADIDSINAALEGRPYVSLRLAMYEDQHPGTTPFNQPSAIDVIWVLFETVPFIESKVPSAMAYYGLARDPIKFSPEHDLYMRKYLPHNNETFLVPKEYLTIEMLEGVLNSFRSSWHNPSVSEDSAKVDFMLANLSVVKNIVDVARLCTFIDTAAQCERLLRALNAEQWRFPTVSTRRNNANKFSTKGLFAAVEDENYSKIQMSLMREVISVLHRLQHHDDEANAEKYFAFDFAWELLRHNPDYMNSGAMIRTAFRHLTSAQIHTLSEQHWYLLVNKLEVWERTQKFFADGKRPLTFEFLKQKRETLVSERAQMIRDLKAQSSHH